MRIGGKVQKKQKCKQQKNSVTGYIVSIKTLDPPTSTGFLSEKKIEYQKNVRFMIRVFLEEGTIR